jgi:hypothetical protein
VWAYQVTTESDDRVAMRGNGKYGYGAVSLPVNGYRTGPRALLSSVFETQSGSAPPPSSEGRAGVAHQTPHPSAVVSIGTAIPRTRKPLQSGYTGR